MGDSILVKGARLHNLKNVTLAIPKNQLVVLTGLSGSGKSTLAFDTLHKEGQRQYLESLGMVTYGSKPAVVSITGLSPSISVDQHLTNRSPRSTVGTATEVFTYLRVLWARIGQRPCPACGRDVPPSYHVSGDEAWDDEPAGDEPDEAPEAGEFVPCPHCGTPVPEMGMAHFSFNKPAGACPTCTGLGTVHQADVHRLVDHERSVAAGAVLRWHPLVNARDAAQRDLLLHGVDSPRFRRHFPGVAPPATVARGRFEGVVTSQLRRYAEHSEDASYRENAEQLLLEEECPDCHGTRLRPESRRVTVSGLTVVDAARLPLGELAAWLDALQGRTTAEEWLVTEPIVADLHERVRRLVDVGVGYLTLERATPSLSAGEAQRLRLAALLGSGLTGVLYVLDEPTIGLHPSDTARLLGVLQRLVDAGNTVVTIEHDLDVVRASDWVIDLGPAGGAAGGEVVAEGTPEAVAQVAASRTGAVLSGS